MRLQIGGEDLLAAGMPEGPEIGRLLRGGAGARNSMVELGGERKAELAAALAAERTPWWAAWRPPTVGRLPSAAGCGAGPCSRPQRPAIVDRQRARRMRAVPLQRERVLAGLGLGGVPGCHSVHGTASSGGAGRGRATGERPAASRLTGWRARAGRRPEVLVADCLPVASAARAPSSWCTRAGGASPAGSSGRACGRCATGGAGSSGRGRPGRGGLLLRDR